MIYKAHDLARLAGDYLIKDFAEDKALTFTNTSFGHKGTVLGSLQAKTNDYEKTIIYALVSTWDSTWDSVEVALVKTIKVHAWQKTDADGNIIRPYYNNEDRQL